MIITNIMPSGAFGVESETVDVVTKLGFLHGGYAPKRIGRYGAKVTCRLDLIEQPLESLLDPAKADMNEAAPV